MQEKETTNWRRFDEEFKRRAVEMIERSGAPVNSARSLGGRSLPKGDLLLVQPAETPSFRPRQPICRRANCYDNAAMESFWSTLKTECFHAGPPTGRLLRLPFCSNRFFTK
jgi:hypothetical protein